MHESRLRNSFFNMISTLGGSMAYDLLYFFLRAVFVRTLAKEYLGVEGLFSNILGMLSLMELGIGSAMMVNLYKPIAEKDKESIKSLMQLYKKAYIIIACAVFVIGASLTPFLKYIIKEIPEGIPNLKLIYLLYVVNSAVSYLFIYKQTIFIADQKNYLVTLWYNCARIIMIFAQMAILLLTHNFIFYLATQIIFTCGANVFISLKANEKYPLLKEKNIAPLGKAKKKEVFSYAYSSTILNVGSKLVNGTDQIIISKMVGLVAGGLYSNYTLATNALLAIEAKIFKSCTASIGNVSATEPVESQKSVFKKIFFLNFWIANVCSCCLACLIQDFICIWVGKTFSLDSFTVICLIAVFYLYSIRITVQVFNDANGSYKYLKYRAFAEGIINLIVSVLFAKIYGITGVVLGTLVSCVLVPFWIEPFVLHKHVFKEGLRKYATAVAVNTIKLFICLVPTYLISLKMTSNNIIMFVIKGIVVFGVSNLIMLLLNIKNENLAFFAQLFKGTLKK